MPVFVPGPTTRRGAWAHRRGERDAVHVLEAQVTQLEKAHDERGDLVAGSLRFGGDTPVLDQLVPVVEPQHRLRVADVHGQQHGSGPS
jgi:hypothetical protein